ncbi:MAG: protein kinase [Pseudomonadota bacterium]|nr:protein kinase [Pseudomonadota bacterium]
MSSHNSTTVIPSATFESIAVERGWITPAQVDECRGLHQTVVEMGLESTLAEVYVKKGYLSAQQSALLQSVLGRTGAVTIPGYEIIEKIAEGGMGAVYKARQISMDRLVGIKVLLQKFADDKDGRERFVREARAVAKLSHPNVVAGIDAGEAHGIYYFVMEFLDGESMDVVLRRRGRVPWEEAAGIVRQVACALDHAQRHGIVHRDVKPGNIMLLKDGTAKLADLGLARVGSATDSTLTQSGMIVGSPAYLSPEQAVGDRELDVRSDIFSLGLTFFELIAGDRAFGSGNPMSTITALLTRNVPVDRLAEMDAPRGVIAVVAKMTWRDPGERYRAPQQLIEDLDALLAGRPPLHALAPEPAARAGSYGLEPGASVLSQTRQRAAGPQRLPRSRRNWTFASAIVALLVAALLAYGNWSVSTQRSAFPLMMPTPAGEIETAIDLRAAIGLAAEVVRDGTVYHAEFEHGEFSIDFAAGKRTINVVVDAVNGVVVKQLAEDEDHSLDVSSARIGLVDALERARKHSPGTAVEAQLLMLPGRVVIEVKIIRDGKPVWVAVNGATGEVSGERLKSLDTP